MNKLAISCRGIKKFYGHKENVVQALKGIDLDIYLNELTLLVGPSGSGKTTLLSILTTILTPDEGDVSLLGHDVKEMNDSEKSWFRCLNLGIVFQSLFLIPTLTVLENISLPLLVAGWENKKANEKAMTVLEKMKLGSRADFAPSELSKGQQQRIAIARAIINDAQIIVCDEPTSALDQNAGLEIMTLLRNLTNHSRAVLVVTHDQRTFEFADRIITINDGLIVQGEKNG